VDAKSASLHEMRFEFCVILQDIAMLQFCFDLLVLPATSTAVETLWICQTSCMIQNIAISLSFKNVSCSMK